MRFTPPPAFMFHPHRTPKDTREDRLRFLVSHCVETPEERAEYVALARPAIEKEWEEHAKWAREAAEKQRRENAQDIESLKRAVIDLRELGLFDIVVKREEAIVNRELQLNGLPKGSDPGSWRSFPEGWGNGELNELWNRRRQAKYREELEAQRKLDHKANWPTPVSSGR